MMNNFFDFIKEDIEAKKILLSSMPLNNKTNIKKYNEKIESIISSYMDYKENLEKYLIAKKDSFKYQIQSNNDEVLEKVCKELSYVRCMLNPLNTYVEKMGLDSLLFDITNYSSFDFEKLNQIIGKIIDKFNIAGIPLVSNDFDYTSYVNEYMTSFLEIRSTKSNYEELEEVFEKIYWFNPEIIEHIELCFRKLIKKYSKQFEEYILKTQKEMLEKYDISDYEDCKKKLKEVYNKIEVIKEEDIDDIVDQAKSGKIEINNYFENSKVRETAYSTLCLEPLDFNNKVAVDKFYDSIFRLKTNLIEYKNYLKFQPLFDDFKNEYERISINLEKINKIQTEINQKESKLESINKKLSNKEDSKPVLFFMKKKNENPKDLKIESVKLAKELYDLYHSLEEENFKKQISNLMSDSLLISDVIRIYRSYDYFKKLALKKVFNLEKYDEVISTSEEFDLFAKNPNNIIVNGIYAFEENDTHKNLINKYRFENINLEDTTLDEESIEILINKIDFILRIKKIEESSLSIEKIWFIVMVNKLIG